MRFHGSRNLRPVIGAALALAAGLGSASAAGDYPVSSCKGWNGTVTERDGLDTRRATMSGIVTKADVQEYCERDPGGETKAFGGRLTTTQCVDKYVASTSGVTLSSRANCDSGTIAYRYDGVERRARFPLGPFVDRSCASGMPPLIEQFKVLCPRSHKAFRLDD